MKNQPNTQQRLVIQNLDTFQDLTSEAAPQVQGGMLAKASIQLDGLGDLRRFRPFPIKPIRPLPPIGHCPIPRPEPLPHPLPFEPVVPVCSLDPDGPLPWCAVIL